MSINMTKQDKLISILREMFQFDQADLDFGIYRIMAMKRNEVEKFLSQDLPLQIQESLAALSSVNNTSEVEKLDAKIKQTKDLFADEPDVLATNLAKYQAQKEILLSKSIDITSLENDIYSHLTNFFSRYYDTGDFISQRRYKEGVYAIPYEGEEIKLHWANADQYYIKTSENFKDYTFKNPNETSLIHFKLIEAETEQNNNKEKEKRLFQLYHQQPFEIKNDELIIYVEYKPTQETSKAKKETGIEEEAQESNTKKKASKNSQGKYINEIISTLKDLPELRAFAWIFEIPNGKDKSLLESHLNKYTAKNSFDYFIHKDLATFLNRELDFYIKNDVVFLDDIDEQDDAKTKAYLSKARTIRKIAKKLITFLAQIEDFQKSLWLKKKFVVESNYCITLDNIDEKFYVEIAKNTAQHDEWVKLFAIDEIKNEENSCAYTSPLSVEFLKNNPYLVLDTAFFSQNFKEQLLGSIDNIDEQTDGLLIHSENFQALNLLQEKYREQVKCVYIDPPYNTKSSEIIYKNSYKHSAWNTLIHNRAELCYELLSDNGILEFAIDDYEAKSSFFILDNIFDSSNMIANICIQHNPRGRNDDKFFGTSHEYMLVYAKNESSAEVRLFNLNGEDILSYNKEDEISSYSTVSYMRTGNNSKRFERPNLYYPIYINPTNLSLSLEKIDGWFELLPIRADGEEKTWRWGKETFLQKCGTEIEVKKDGDSFKLNKKRRLEGAGKKAKTLWFDSKYDASSHGIMLLKNIFNSDIFNYPKSINTVYDSIFLVTTPHSLILDYFAGSGTTGHAVINLNREDNGKRKYILVEMGEYFDTVTKPRIQKVIYSDDWKSGKPVSRKGSSHIMKYIRLESYEDTLNNLVLEAKHDLMSSALQEEYMLSYMLTMESKKSLLNIEQLRKPFSYTMEITRKQEKKEKFIDLVETFNYLIGLYVVQNSAMQSYDARFTTSNTGAMSAKLKTGTRYKIKMIEGQNLEQEKILVIWREMTDNTGKREEEIDSNIQKDNAVLDAFFTTKKMHSPNFNYDKIYVNCDNNLTNLRTEKESWRVTLIEEELKKRMFEGS